MNRIAIIGSPGAGKSTFARLLGDLTGIEVFHLDGLFWNPGWVETPRAAWIQLQEKLVQRPSWIIDGNYGSTMDIRIQAADTVIFLDFPRYICLWRAIKRAVQFRGKTRPDMGEGCAEKIDLEFIQYIWGFRRREDDKINRRLNDAIEEGKQVIRLRTNAEVDAYLTSLPPHG
ncbi:DNA topology modulation protein [Alicyclobacillus sp. SO9]|uniref:DNA topology modulation protein n=1 Tax=Alicyclobacillus sp. SO9 TaxID=2665646 RepID=UPI0018E6E1FA|nr:DNA topology modulation protein [Alicyclobacillus sp. SO9]QQE80495.1 DNA topology modulation protein [Alicyclobacillus sp. SO9]